MIACDPAQRPTALSAYHRAQKVAEVLGVTTAPPRVEPVPMCVRECAAMNCCYKLVCGIREGTCKAGTHPQKPAKGCSNVGEGPRKARRAGRSWLLGRF